MTDKRDPTVLFQVFREIVIIEQLSRTFLEAHLPDGLIAPHFNVLSHLNQRGNGDTPVKIARAFQVAKTTMTHTLKGLEKGGYVIIRPNPDDGRSKQVWLTEGGRGLLSQVIQRLAPELGKLVGGIDLDRLAQITPVLADLRFHLDQARDPLPDAPDR